MERRKVTIMYDDMSIREIDEPVKLLKDQLYWININMPMRRSTQHFWIRKLND